MIRMRMRLQDPLNREVVGTNESNHFVRGGGFGTT